MLYFPFLAEIGANIMRSRHFNLMSSNQACFIHFYDVYFQAIIRCKIQTNNNEFVGVPYQ